jgi:acetate kinase
MLVLVLNVGSSSIRTSVVDEDGQTAATEHILLHPAQRIHPAVHRLLQDAPEVDVIGHRFVHGGSRFRKAVVITDEVVGDLDSLAELAPLHNPPSLEAIRAARSQRPETPQVACFDTAFHATLPQAAAIYAIPRAWTEELGIRRYGFHGLSHAYAAQRAADLLRRQLSELRLVTCHLGAGASLCAVERGRSVDTTMGFTPLAGLAMATRCGDLDPGAVLYLQEHLGLTPGQMRDALERESGLLGIAGTSDMRELEDQADNGSPRAALALAVYVHRLRAGIAAMTASLDGVDGIVFTGGVGEHSARVRDAACEGLGYLGVRIAGGSDRGPHDRLVNAPGSPVAVAVVEAREDVQIARDVRALLRPSHR